MCSEAVRYTPNYSASDYRQWEGDWELWDGIPVCMSPSPAAKHQLVGGNLLSLLKTVIAKNDACQCLVVYETDWQIGDSTVVRPDIAVLCHGLPEAFIDYPPSLVVEILSPSTADKDRTAKRQLYEKQGVAIYLMVDPEKKSLEGLQLKDDKYQPIPVVDGVITVEWSDDCSAAISVQDVFRQ